MDVKDRPSLCFSSCTFASLLLFFPLFLVYSDKPKFGGPGTRKQACV